MKKIYFLLFAFSFFIQSINAQNPSDRDRTFNEFNLPINNYFVDEDILKSRVLPDGKILILTQLDELFKLDGNLKDSSFNVGTGFKSSTSNELQIYDFAVQNDGKILVIGNFKNSTELTFHELLE